MGQAYAVEIKPAEAPAALRLEPVTARIGAEVTGFDMSQVPSPAEVAQLLDALVRYKVLFFRDQNITRAQHVAFGRAFGDLEIHPFAKTPAFGNDPEFPEIIVVESTAERPSAADRWHSDTSFREDPSMGSILRCRVAPPAGGDTLWADMAAAYEGLDDATRSQVSSLVALHDPRIFEAGMRANGASEAAILDHRRNNPPVEHPLVRTHPVTGEKILYVNGNFTVGIKGMNESESRPLLQRLFRQASIPDYQVRFRWRVDSVAFWDNRSTQHYATNDFFPQHRKMERVTIAGDRPF